ncbi:MAG: polyprenol monophosphomannose synthase [Candidatus Dormiibacterota bacterium]
MDAGCELSVVIPTRNEAGTLPALYARLTQALSGISAEVLIVDDSTDTVTRPALRQIAAADSAWRVVERAATEPRGLGAAVSVGLAMARGDAVCVMDGDLQHPPAVIPALLEAVRQGADLAVASRYAPGGSALGLSGPFRKLVSKSVSWVAQAFFSETRRTTDPLSGFFCVRQRCIAGLELRPVGFKILLELLVCLPGVRVVDVPFEFAPRFAGESKATISQGILFGKHVLSLIIFVPLTALLGKVAVSAGAGMAVFVAVVALLTDLPLRPPAPWLLATVTSLLASVGVYGLLTFRSAFWRMGMAGQRLLWIAGLFSVAGGIVSFVLLTAKAHLATVLLALVALVLAQLVGSSLVTYLRHKARRATPVVSLADELSLQALARRMGADYAWWIEPQRPSEAPPRVEQLVTAEVVSHVIRSGRPVLLTELPSSRRQARINVGSFSVVLIPQLAGTRKVVRIATLARAGRTPFSARDLYTCVAWQGNQEGAVGVAGEEPPALAGEAADPT